MKIAIIDYNNSSVKITNIPEFDSNDEIETYITEKLGFRVEDVAWLYADHISVSIDI